MRAYYCIVNLPGAPAREIAAVSAADDAGAVSGLRRLSLAWPGFETITLFEGERTVAVLANPAFGFPPSPSDPLAHAA